METQRDTRIIFKILLIFIAITVLGVSPRPHQVTEAYHHARLAISFNSLPSAAHHLAAIAQQLPWRSDLWEQAGAMAIEGASYELAVDLFETARSENDLSSKGMLALGDAYGEIGEHENAVSAWEEHLQENGPSPEPLARLAEAFESQGEYQAAAEALKSLVTVTDPGSTYASLVYRTGIMLAAAQPEAAPAYLTQAAELDSNVSSKARKLTREIERTLAENEPAYTFVTAGRSLAEQNDWKLAEYAFIQAVQVRPDYADAWAFLGEAQQQVVLHSGGELASSGETALQNAQRLDPDSIIVNMLMALYFQRRGDYPSALSYLDAAISLNPGNPDVLVELGKVTATTGDLAAAQNYYEQAIESAPGNGAYLQAFVNFCITYNVDLRETALPAARDALMLSPDDPTSLDVMGHVMLRLEDLHNAERYLLQALEKDPAYSPAHLHLGSLYLLKQDLEQAAYHLHRAVEFADSTATASMAQRMLDDYINP